MQQRQLRADDSLEGCLVGVGWGGVGWGGWSPAAWAQLPESLPLPHRLLASDLASSTGKAGECGLHSSPEGGGHQPGVTEKALGIDVASLLSALGQQPPKWDSMCHRQETQPEP